MKWENGISFFECTICNVNSCLSIKRKGCFLNHCCYLYKLLQLLLTCEKGLLSYLSFVCQRCPQSAELSIISGHSWVLVVEATERVVQALGLERHAILVEAAHYYPTEDLAILELSEETALLQNVKGSVLHKSCLLRYIPICDWVI